MVRGLGQHAEKEGESYGSSPEALSSVVTTSNTKAEGSWLDGFTGGNQFMSAGLGVMAVGAVIAVARSSVKRAASFAKHQMLGMTVSWLERCRI